MAEPVSDVQAPWWVYMLDCDGRLYTGITRDPQRRLAEHAAGGSRGARFTRGARRLALRYAVAVGSRSTALRAEHRIRRMSRPDKQALLRMSPTAARLLVLLGIDR